MTNFTQYWEHINWDDVCFRISKQTSKDANIAILNFDVNVENHIISLLSFSAKRYINLLIKIAKKLTRQRFGNIINFYLPLYLSNLCSNDCTYCGFSISNNIKRKILNTDEIIEECKAIRAKGIDHFLLVTGEHKTKVGIDYFCKIIPIVKNYSSSVLIEVQPMYQEDYMKLKQIGLNGVLVYQETYNKLMYEKHHLKGKKRDFFWRLETPDRLGRAKVHKIGLGILIGLSNNWRADFYILAKHLLYLRKVYWRSTFSLSFPRLRPCVGQANDKSFEVMDDLDLLQMMCAFRIIAPEVEISLSTRESPKFRDYVTPIVVNSISAGSKTQPGGYASNQIELEQFMTCDNRTTQEVANKMLSLGLQPVWKDWDSYLGCM
ncbi:MAG: 2-iminoacetate synthase ThiH (plasmid) [Pantoea sp. Brub]|nr:2-iminoacetate synthase ThiH [Pantoea sp. Brub]